VDDDSRNVFAITSVLEERGLNVISAGNGREGIDRLQAHPEINLVLMDVMMPEMDGYEAIGIIRKIPRYEHLPIIALTAKAMKEDRDNCIEAGANDYLAKPVDSQKLLSLLRVWLYK
jgi:tubulin-specific chaperone A